MRAGAQTGSDKNVRALGYTVGRSVGEPLESVSKVEQSGLSDDRSVGSGGQTHRSERRAVGASVCYVVCLFD